MRATIKLFACFLLFFVLVHFANEAKAQGCLGADGTGIGGGVARIQNGFACVNQDNALPASSAKGAIHEVTASNVFGADVVEARINWNDGSGFTAWFTLTDIGGGIRRSSAPKHFFPATNTACEYSPTTELRVNGVVCSTNFGTPPVYFRWNIEGTANAPSSVLSVTNTANAAQTTIEVCAGATTTVSFTDRSNLNCNTNPGDVTIAASLNNRRRWRQFVYGGAGTLNSITGGVTVGPTNIAVPNGTSLDGVVDTYTITSGAPVGPPADDQPLFNAAYTTPPTPTQTLNITVPATAQAGEQFIVTTRYWNGCNRYDQSEAPVEYNQSRILVVAQPSPPTATNQAVCNGTAINPFTITGVPAGATARFYRNANGAPNSAVLLGTDNTSPYQLPVASYVAGAGDSIEAGTPGIYKVWASYIPAVVGATNCESIKIPVTIIIRPTITNPAAITGPTQVCNDNATQYDFSEGANSPTMSPNPAWATNLVGGATTYSWSWDNNTGISAISPSGTTNKNLDDVLFNISSGTFGAAASLTRQLRVNSAYTGGTPVCTTPNTTLNVQVFRQTVGGSLAPTTATICDGSSTGTLTLSGHVGTILRWERIYNAGAPEVIANTTTTYSEVPPYGAGSYVYRAVLQNGVCGTTNSGSTTITVNPVPAKPSISQGAGSNGLTICVGQQTVLQSNNPGGLAAIYRWFKTTDLVTPVQATASNTLTLNSVAQSGNYVVQVVGVAPSNCASPLSDPITVTINALPSVVSVTGGGAACDGNPAPDIIFTFSGGTPYNFTIDVPVGPDLVVTGHNSNTYTLSGQIDPGNYQISSLSNGCTATSLGSAATVTSSGGSPVFDGARVLTPTAACNAGASTTDPSLTFSIQNIAATGYILTYRIDGGANRTKNFNTDATGTPTAALVFSDAELNNVGGHTIRIVSIQSPTGCLGVFNEDIAFTVNALPAAPTSGGNVIACSDVIGTATVSATVGAGQTVDWYTASSGGTLLLSGNTTLNPAPANEPTPGNVVTYFAEARNTTTGCISSTRTGVTLRSDARPSAPNAGIDFEVCAQPTGPHTATLAATAANNGGTGTWTGPAGVTFGSANSPTSTVSGLAIGANTLTWTVRSAQSGNAGACANQQDQVVVTVNALPVSNNPTPVLCETVAGTLIALSTNLTTYHDAITGIAGSTNRTVEWFTAATRLAGNKITDPTDVDVTNSLTLYTIVTNTVTGCVNRLGTVTFTVVSQPTANARTFEFCEEFPGGSNQALNIDLTANTYIDQITGIVGSTNRAVTWFHTLADANANTNPITDANSYDILSGNETVFARVAITSGTACVNVAQIDLVIKPRPADPTILGSDNQCVGAIGLYNVPVVAGASYFWEVDDGPGEFAVLTGGGTGDFITVVQFPNVYTGDISVTLEVNGCASNKVTKTVKVNATPPAVVITASADPVCANQTGVTYTATSLPLTDYTWEIPVVGGATGSSIIGGQGSNQVTVNVGSVSGNIRVTPQTQGGSCPGSPATFFIDVRQRPTMATYTVPAATVCSDTPINIDFTVAGGSVPAPTFRITNVTVPPGLSPSTRAFNPATPVLSTEIHNDAFTNTTGGNLDVRYTVVPVSADGCEGSARDIFARIRPEPVLAPNLVATVCSGDPNGLVFTVASGSIPADQFEITSIVNLGGLTATAGAPTTGFFGPNEIADDVWMNTTGVQQEIQYFVRPINTTTGCVGDPAIPVRVLVNPQPVVTSALTSTICSGDAPSVTLTSSIAGSTFQWTLKSTTGLITGGGSGTGSIITNILVNGGVTAGTATYEIVATGPVALGTCAGAPVDLVVTVNPAPLTNNVNKNVCSTSAGGNTFIEDLIALQPSINADGSLAFSWHTSQADALANTNAMSVATASAFPLVNGVPVFVRVSNGTCARIQEVKYTVFKSPSVTANALLFNGFAITCNGASNGQIIATATPDTGTSPYQFTINGSTYFPSGAFNALAPGSYTVRVRDKEGCEVNSGPITIAEPTPVVASAASTTNALCKGSNTGSIVVAGAGGVGGYTYSLNGGAFQPSATFTGLTAGTYTITVKDANGCTDSELTTITEPTLVTGSITSQTNVDCNGNSTGAVEVTGAGGVGPYMYSLNSGAFQNAPGIFTGLAAGNYTITVRDANLCTANVNVVVTQPAVLSLALGAKTDVACNGNATGSITVIGSGGTSPYQYNIGSGFQASGTFSGLTAATYNIIVRDAQNCSTNINVTINQPALLTASITSQTNVNCFGNATGSVTVNGTGGTGTYLFAIDGVTFGGSGSFSGLTAGNYNVTVRDQANCSVIVPITITEPTALSGSLVNSTDALCNGSSSGTAEIIGSGGTAPYQYSINGGGLFVASGLFTGLAAGSYTVIVRDNNQCTFSVPFTINQPTALSAGITAQTNVDCNGNSTGSVTITATGGTGAYSFNIGGGFQSSGTFTGIAAGTYSVVVRDANFCTTSVPVTITQPPVLTISLSSKTDPLCNGGTNGSIVVTGNGGTAPYQFDRGAGFQASGTFSGLGAGTYTIVVRDARGCTATLPNIIINEPTLLTGIITGQTNVACFGGNTGSVTVNGQGGTGTYTYSIGGGFQANGTFSGLTAGNYTVTVADQNGCTTDVFVTISEPTQLGGSFTSTDALCKGSATGSVTVTGTGGTAPYQYSINGVLFLSSGLFVNLTAGSYTVKVRDNNQCTFDVNFTINEPTQVSVSVSAQTNVDCKGSATGSVTAAGAGGVGGYTYSIDNGAFQLSPTFTGLTAGNHTVKVRDANFCETSTIAIITEPALLVVNIASQLNVDCNGNATGSVTLNGTGGTGAYQFSVVPFGNAPGVFGVGATFGGLVAGLYTAYIRDANLCISSITVTITEPAVLGLGIVTQVNVVCNGQNTGSVVVQAIGGTQPYQYSIDAGSLSASNTFTGLAQGSYTVHVRDFNGCTQSIPVTITENTAVTGTLAVTSNGGALYNGFGVSCFNSSNGQITVQGVTGGTGGYTFQLVQDLSNTPIGNVFNNVRANPAYTVIIRDNSGCSVTVGPIAVTQPNQLTIDISKAASYNGFDVSCVNATDGAIRIDASTGGSGNNTYTLIKDGVDFAGPASGALPLTFSTLATSTAIGKGVYMVRVQDSNTCSVTSTPQIIVDPPDLFAGFLAPQPAKCFNSDPAPIVQLSAPVGGIGSATYTYRWFESTDDVTYTEIIGETGVSYDPPTTITQVSQDTPYQHYYKRETTSGCNVKISAAVSITVNPLPRVTVSTLNPPPAFVCEDQPLIFEYDFAPGQAPFFLSYTAITRNPAGVIIQTDMITDRLSGSSTPIVIPQFKDDMEFIVTRIRDFNHCEGTVFPPNVIVEVGKADASFAVVGPNPQCSGSEFTFQWDADPDVAYTWTWPDGASTPQPAAGLDGVNTINKIIAVPNTATQTKLPVVLSAQNTTYPTCPADLHIEYVNIHPEITPGWVIPSDTVCSGTPINITNLTLSSAGSVHTWTVKRLSDGFIETALGRSGAFKSMEEFIITNDNHNAGMTIPPDVPKNPERYEITYKIENTPGNGSCSKFIRDTVTVYRGAVAKIGAPKDPLQTTFTWGDNLGPNNGMLINFENHSDPLDGGDFEYTWVFSNNNANTPPETFVSSAASVPYEFMNPGINKKAILTVVNTDARDIAHLPNGCATTDEFTFEIDVPPLVAAFTIDAVKSCVPVTLSVTNNSTPLMFNKWTIVNETVGGIPRESNDFKPNFPVQEPGRYRITLKIRNPSFPDQEAYYVSAVDQTVDLYENPIASFTTAPDQRIFIPDQELRTDNRSETAYDEISDSYLDIYYHWYFGDGSDTIKSVVNPNSLDPLSGHSPTHRYETEGLDTIRLVAINFHGTYACRDTATRIIRAVAAGTSKVPNAFTPNPGGPNGGIVNEDGTTINDVFLPVTKGVKEFQMQIFDRWGNLVFQSTQQNKGWDGYDRNGNLMPAGVYVYKLVLRMANDQRTTQVGDVTLIR